MRHFARGTCTPLRATIGACLALAAQSAHAQIHLAFAPDPVRPAPGIIGSSFGCAYEPGVAQGILAASSSNQDCRSGLMGSDPVPETLAYAPAESAAAFETPSLPSGLSIGGHSNMVLYFWSQEATNGVTFVTTTLAYVLREQFASGELATIVTGSHYGLPSGFRVNPARVEFPFEVPAYTLQPGSRLQILLSSGSTDSRIFFGGQFSDAGITLANAGGSTSNTGPIPDVALPGSGSQQSESSSGGESAGPVSESVLLVLVAGFAVRRGGKRGGFRSASTIS